MMVYKYNVTDIAGILKECSSSVNQVLEGCGIEFTVKEMGSVHSRNFKTGAHRAPTWQKRGDITKKCGPTCYHSPHRSRLSPVSHAFIG